MKYANTDIGLPYFDTRDFPKKCYREKVCSLCDDCEYWGQLYGVEGCMLEIAPDSEEIEESCFLFWRLSLHV